MAGILFASLITILGCLALACMVFTIFHLSDRRKAKPTTYQVKIHFAHGIKIKLVLNPEQYEQLEAFLLQADGFWQIGDEADSIKVYREFICLVEVKRK